MLAYLLGVGVPRVSRPARRVYEESARISTGVRSLDDLLEGGIEVGSITEFIGEFGAGKTQICHQLSVMVQLPKDKGGLNARALYVDTEGTFRPERIVQIARARGLDPEKTLENIIYARAYSLGGLEELLSKALAEVVKGDVGLVVLDEATRLVRASGLGAGERARAYAAIVSSLEAVAEAGSAVVVARQVVFGDGVRPAGGAALDGYAHLSVFLSKRGSAREARVLSSPWRGGVALFAVSEEGVVDV